MALTTTKMSTNYKNLWENWPLGGSKCKFDRSIKEHTANKIADLNAEILRLQKENKNLKDIIRGLQDEKIS